MAQYKVPQNVEAEDKILGPLSLRQFIYVIIALMWGFLMWRIFLSAPIIAFVAALPVSGTFLALGLIQREEQSFENYFIAMLRFIIVPRKRVWHKDMTNADIVRSETPVKQPQLVSHHDPAQLRGQLQKLALVVDTRGRAVKSSEIQLPDEANQAAAIAARVNVGAKEAAEAPAINVTAEDDILDMKNNKQAAAVGHLLENVEADIRAEAVEKMQHPSRTPEKSPTVALSPTPNQDDILDLALNSGGLSVAQIGKSANRASDKLVENQAVSLR